MGSTTKMYTAAAILRLVDAGKFGLDDKALPLFDTLWTKLNGTSIVHALGSQIKEVTVRHLLQMRSGIPDFDNLASRGYQFDHPREDLGPVKELSFLEPGQEFDCDPGTCGEYSSSNYELLGLILAQQAGASSWDDYKQATGLPKDVLAQMPNTNFAVHGPCSKYTEVHAYSSEQNPPVDVYNVSCTNGWTCGNLISNGGDAAFFVRALLGNGERVVRNATRQEMLKTSPLTTGWSTGLEYGLGVMDLSRMVGEQAGSFIGHGGETYGFNAQTAYSRKHDFGLSLVANTENTFLISRIAPAIYKVVVSSLSSANIQTVMV
jgi:D-alanyl-D-alanine carboxypeptidase